MLPPIDDLLMTGSLGKQVLPDVDMEKYKGDDINTQDTLILKEPPELLHMASPKLKDPLELLFQLSPNDPDKSLPNQMEKMDSSDDKDKSKGAVRVEDVVVDDVASSTEQDELKNWLPHMMKWSFLSNDEANNKVRYMNTCPLDSTLQLLWMLWKRGALLDEMFSND